MADSPSTEQLLIQVLMRSWQETLETIATSEAGSPEREQALQRLEGAFAPIWARVQVVELACDGARLTYEGFPVLTPEVDKARIVETLTTSGIHGLTLAPGVERGEMGAVLELIDRKQRLDEDGDQDLVLMLFRADLHHLRYTVGPPPKAAPVEPVTDTEAAPSPARSDEGAEQRRAALRAEAASPDRTDGKDGIVRLEDFDSTLYFLEPREIDYLRNSVEREYAQDHSQNVLAILLDTLELQQDYEVQAEVVGVLRTLLPYLLGTGRFPAVAYLTSELRRIGRTMDLSPDLKDSLAELRSSISLNDTLTQLFHVLEGGSVAPSADELGALLREMKPDAIRTVLVWIGQLNRPEAKAALVTALEAFFTEWPAALTQMTESRDRAVVQRALGLARRLQLPELTPSVTAALAHPDPPTRRAAVQTLVAIGSQPAMNAVARSIEDEAGPVRTAVYEGLAARPVPAAQPALARQIEGRDLETREVSERRALFAAYGVVTGAEGVEPMERFLEGKGSLTRRTSPETRACAAVALGLIGTSEAFLALERTKNDREPIVRSAVNRALREAAS